MCYRYKNPVLAGYVPLEESFLILYWLRLAFNCLQIAVLQKRSEDRTSKWIPRGKEMQSDVCNSNSNHNYSITLTLQNWGWNALHNPLTESFWHLSCRNSHSHFTEEETDLKQLSNLVTVTQHQRMRSGVSSLLGSDSKVHNTHKLLSNLHKRPLGWLSPLPLPDFSHPLCGLFHECLPLGGGREPWEHVTKDVTSSSQSENEDFLEEATL